MAEETVKQESDEYCDDIKLGKMADPSTYTLTKRGQRNTSLKSLPGNVAKVTILESSDEVKLSARDDGETRNFVMIGDREVEFLGDVMNMEQHAKFMSEISSHSEDKYFKSKSDDYIVPIDNMLVYTDFDYDDPGISKIIYFDSNDYTDIAIASDYILEAESGRFDYEQARIIIERIIGEGFVRQYTPEMFGVSDEYDRQVERGKSRSDAYHAERQQERRGFHYKVGENSGQYHADDARREFAKNVKKVAKNINVRSINKYAMHVLSGIDINKEEGVVAWY